ncbi:MAG TPA: sensor domain-containing diguanylate cyclase [Geopsychrobacteraceae bacterium]|nr:sensor domain-containing diguanylate cyclase [Geopsychrobacteraceae bacterium]
MNDFQRLREIVDVAQVVVSSLDLDEVLQRILQITREMVDVPAGSIALYNKKQHSMELHAIEGLSEDLSANKSWQIETDSLTQVALNQNSLYVVEDTGQVTFKLSSLARAAGIRSLIAVPLTMHGQTVGILFLNDFVPRTFAADDLERLTIISSFAALSIVNARLHQKTSQLAVTDGLTGLYNYRQFKSLLAQELQRAQRYRHPLSLIMFDIDNFKTFNDSYGHPCGDQILVQIASTLRDIFRGADLVFRYGGEEFTIILPEANLDQAVIAAERTRMQIGEMGIEWPGVQQQLRVTASAGVATFPDDGIAAECLLNSVDELLYRAKREGKNCVYFNELLRKRAYS